MTWKTLALLAAITAMTGTVSAEPEPDPRYTYILIVEAKGYRETPFSGWYSVNGKRIEIENRSTPFRFVCEAGETIEGSIRTADPQRQIVVKVMDHGYSRRRPAAKMWGPAMRFAWAQPGVGPRYVKLDDSIRD